MSDDLNFTSPNPAEIIKDIENKLANPPSEVAINLIITGNTAKKYHFVKSILTSSYPEIDEENIDKYFLIAGINKELERIAHIWKEDE